MAAGAWDALSCSLEGSKLGKPHLGCYHEYVGKREGEKKEGSEEWREGNRREEEGGEGERERGKQEGKEEGEERKERREGERIKNWT